MKFVCHNQKLGSCRNCKNCEATHYAANAGLLCTRKEWPPWKTHPANYSMHLINFLHLASRKWASYAPAAFDSNISLEVRSTFLADCSFGLAGCSFAP